MRFGFVIPIVDVRLLPDLAAEAEAAGWDGVFIPDCISIDTPEVPPQPYPDPWVALGAIAARTERIRIGPMVTPVSRRRPWKLAQEAVTVDHLSQGRMILAVGLGAAQDDAGFYRTGEVMQRKERARMLDEGLEIITGLWSGERYTFHGEHYHIEDMALLPAPVQQPRIPIWVVGAWPRQSSMRRALKFDGLLPAIMNADGSFASVTPEAIRDIAAYVATERAQTTPFDIVWEGRTPGDDVRADGEVIRPFVAAGITWWLETMWDAPNHPDDVRRRIRLGPPRLD